MRKRAGPVLSVNKKGSYCQRSVYGTSSALCVSSASLCLFWKKRKSLQIYCYIFQRFTLPPVTNRDNILLCKASDYCIWKCSVVYKLKVYPHTNLPHPDTALFPCPALTSSLPLSLWVVSWLKGCFKAEVGLLSLYETHDSGGSEPWLDSKLVAGRSCAHRPTYARRIYLKDCFCHFEQRRR